MNPYASAHWTKVDQIYSFARRELATRRDWRHGPARVREVAKEAFDALTPFTSLAGRRYCDLGCGVYHPFGVSAAMFLNGAASTLATDLHGPDAQRAAEALFDMISDCLLFPDAWHWSKVSRGEFLRRARQFDLNALRSGDLQLGITKVPMEHLVTDIHHPTLKLNAIDLMASRAVLEHFSDFGVASDRMFSLMSKGGLAYHLIDIVDHRAYENTGHHFWSSLAEGDDWTDGLCNRLRPAEFRRFFQNSGFEILKFETCGGPMPAGFRDQIIDRFKSMPDEELNPTTIKCVLRRP